MDNTCEVLYGMTGTEGAHANLLVVFGMPDLYASDSMGFPHDVVKGVWPKVYTLMSQG